MLPTGEDSDWARTVRGNNPEFILIARPFSNFDFVERRFQGIVTMRRILSQVRQHDGKTAIIEEIEDSKDLQQENEDIGTRYPEFSSAKAFRITFFKREFSTVAEFSKANQEDFIGYAIIKEDNVPGVSHTVRIYESVLKLSRCVNNFVRDQPEWRCSAAGKMFNISGYLYAQQNCMTNVCAHVAVRTAACRFHKSGDMTYREMNQLIGVDHVNRKVGGKDGGGLDTREMTKILETIGANTIVIDYTKPSQSATLAPFQKVLYGSIESGFPAIVVFETIDKPCGKTPICHAIPVFGHTFNEDTWVYRAESSYFKVGEETLYIPSESWVSMYIAHDDNWGSNFCVPRRYLHTRSYCDQVQEHVCGMDKGCVLYVIGTYPKEVLINALQAEVMGADYLFTILPQLPDTSEVWRRRLCEYARNGQLILRPILLKGEEYSKHMSNISDWHQRKLGYVFSGKRDRWLWMIELSVPELFPANQRKVGEVILEAEVKPRSDRDFKSFLFARLPGYFGAYKEGGPANPIYDFIPCNLMSHVELYGCEETWQLRTTTLARNSSFKHTQPTKMTTMRYPSRILVSLVDAEFGIRLLAVC